MKGSGQGIGVRDQETETGARVQGLGFRLASLIFQCDWREDVKSPFIKGACRELGRTDLGGFLKNEITFS